MFILIWGIFSRTDHSWKLVNYYSCSEPHLPPCINSKNMSWDYIHIMIFWEANIWINFKNYFQFNLAFALWLKEAPHYLVPHCFLPASRFRENHQMSSWKPFSHFELYVSLSYMQFYDLTPRFHTIMDETGNKQAVYF